MKRFLIRLAALAAVLLVVAAVAAPRLGAWLVVEDPLHKADAIFVLGGTMFERPLEAVDLYHEGWAPRVLLMRQIADFGEAELDRRGVTFQREIDVQVDVLTKLGVPRPAIEILPPQNSTRDEADALFTAATTNHWARVIVVTSKQHTRRARMVIVGAWPAPARRSSCVRPAMTTRMWTTGGNIARRCASRCSRRSG